MTGVFTSEFLKLRTTRSFWWTMLAAFALLALITIVPLAQGVDNESDLRSLLANAGIVGLFMVVLGVVGAAGEYRHGTITSSLLAVPDRLRFLFAKAVAYAAAGAIAAAVSLVLMIVLTVIFLSGDGTSISGLGIDSGALAGIALGTIVYTALGGALGVALGAILRNQVAAVVGVLLLLLFIDPILGGLVHSYGKFSLSGIGIALSGGTSGDAGFAILSRAAAAAVYTAYVALLLAACVALDSRRDVSS